MKRVTYILVSVLVIMWFFPTSSYAYIDPATGSMLLQMLGVAFFAVSGTLIAFKNRIAAFFKRRKALRNGEDPDRYMDEESHENHGVNHTAKK